MNVTSLFLQHAGRTPDRTALIFGEESLSFAELHQRVNHVRALLEREGFQPGDRIILLVPISVTLYSLILGILASGVVPVFIDPSMGLKRMSWSIRKSGARALISGHAFLKYRWLIRPLWGMRLFSVDSAGLGLVRWPELDTVNARELPENLPLVERAPDDHGIITYTTGSTGTPKGADRTQSILLAQQSIIRQDWPDREDETDLVVFPMMALQNLASGVTSCVPGIDFRKVSEFSPEKLLALLERYSIKRIAAPPGFLRPLVRHVLKTAQPNTTVRSVITGGAPISPRFCAEILKAFPASEPYVIYGSTEAEPISYKHMREVAQGALNGYAVGAPIRQTGLRIRDGEIQVSGPHVVRRYLNNPEADRATKLHEADGTVWHRTGDCGFLDTAGEIWLTGRLSDRIRSGTEFHDPYPAELRVENVSGVERAAWVQNAQGRSGWFIELSSGADAHSTKTECLRLISELSPRAPLQILKNIPVDHRHNWKIDRASLRKLL